MKQLIQREKAVRQRGFTLIEVIIATGILATSILAIIAFLGATGQATSEVMNTTVASRIADNIRAELQKADLDNLYGLADPNNPLELFATKDGERVRIDDGSGSIDEVDGDDDPPGIALGNRFFLIEIRRLENSLEFSNSTEFQDSAMLPLSVQIVWPYRVKTGPDPEDPDDSVLGAVEKQSRYIFNTTILRKP